MNQGKLSVLFVTLFCSLIAGSPCAYSLETKVSHAADAQAYKLYVEGEKLVQSGNYDKALPVLSQAAKHDPSSYSQYVRWQLAVCYRKKKQFSSAIREAKAALEFDPALDSALYELALCYWESGKYDLCESSLERFIGMSRDARANANAQKFLKDVAVYSKLDSASKKIEKQRYSEAVNDLNAAVKYDPSPYSASIHSSLAFALVHLGQPEKAIAEGKKALELDPTDKATIYNTVIAFQDVANFDEAIVWLDRYLSMESDPAQIKAAQTFLIELKEDRKQYNNADNKLPDYLDQMRKDLNSARWPKEAFPLKVYIYSGSGVKGYRSEFDNYILNALDTWCDSSGQKLSYELVNVPDQANLKVKWQGTELKGISRKDHRLKAGLTNLRWNSQRQIDSADLYILTVEAFNLAKPVERGVCASICMHEVGHALGLGHSSYIYDVMYFRSSSKQTGRPTKRDKSTIARLYASYPVLGKFKHLAKPLPAGQKVKYLPPPTFLPPTAPKTDKILPPVFLPPPKKREIKPPVFTPPPKSARPARPTFLPPPISSKPTPKDKRKTGTGAKKPPIFLPPPAR